MQLKHVLKSAFGFFALGLGAIGLLIPIFPTTPFVLLSIGCFATMPKIQSKILKIKIFREYYQNRTIGTPINKKTVFASLGVLWGLLGLSAIIAQNLWISAILSVVGIAITVHILLIAKGKKK